MRNMLFVCIILLGVSVYAQEKEERKYFQKGDKLISFIPIPIGASKSGDLPWKIEPNLYLSGEYFFKNNLSFGLDGSYLGNIGVTSLDTHGNDVYESYNEFTLGGYAKYWFRKPENKFRPYLGLGFEYSTYKFNKDGNVPNYTAQLPATNIEGYLRLGFNYSFNKRWYVGCFANVNKLGYFPSENQKWKVGINPMFTIGFKF